MGGFKHFVTRPLYIYFFVFYIFISHSKQLTPLLLDADTPEFCYLLSSCSKRMIENVQCTIGANNFLDVKLFVPNLAACQQHCETTQGCRYLKGGRGRKKTYILCMTCLLRMYFFMSSPHIYRS